MKKKLGRVNRYIVAVVFFVKNTFVMGLKEVNFDLVSRLQDNVVLFYSTFEKPTGKKGRFKLYDGKINMANPDKPRVQKIEIAETNGQACYLVFQRQGKVQAVYLYLKGHEQERCHSVLPHPFSNRVLFQGCQRLHRTYTISGKGCCKAIVQL